jgi:hypothetical protein
MAVVIVAVAFAFGYGGGSVQHSIARGQRLQFVVVSIVTLGVFTVWYLGGYLVGKQRLLRRKQSTDRRAHSRQWKNEA